MTEYVYTEVVYEDEPSDYYRYDESIFKRLCDSSKHRIGNGHSRSNEASY